MSASDSQLAVLKSLEGASFGKKLATYGKMSGPGWVQAAVTLGGGSLVGALYLGVIGGYQFMWLQPLAMLCGIIMLAAISYVTLSVEERPFRLVKKHVSPTLAWGWLVATIIADVVFCSAQFGLGTGAVKGNLGGEHLNDYFITGCFATVSIFLIYSYIRGGKTAALVENVLKFLVAIVVLAFMGVVIKLSIDGQIVWGEIFKGLIPNVSALFKPTESFTADIAATGSNAEFWTGYIKGNQQNNIIAAFGSAVGINMTFLLPYTLRKKGWGKPHRELSRYDLVLGLFVPFILATSFLVIAASSQFHAKNTDVFAEDGSVIPAAAGGYAGVLVPALKSIGEDVNKKTAKDKVIALAEEKLTAADRELAGKLVKRNANALAGALEPFLGKAAQPVFGIGVLAMAISTMLVHMMMNGFAVSEAFGKPGEKSLFMFGALVPAIAGFFSPILMVGETRAALVIPAVVIAFVLLPIAYLAFFLLMNSRNALGEAMPKRRGLVNGLLALSLALTTFGCIWKVNGIGGWKGNLGLVVIAVFFVIGIVGFMKRNSFSVSK